MEEYGVAVKFWDTKDCDVPADLAIVYFWPLYVLKVRESSAVGEGSLSISRELTSSQKEKYIVGQLSVACQSFSYVMYRQIGRSEFEAVKPQLHHLLIEQLPVILDDFHATCCRTPMLRG